MQGYQVNIYTPGFCLSVYLPGQPRGKASLVTTSLIKVHHTFPKVRQTSLQDITRQSEYQTIELIYQSIINNLQV